MEPNLSQALHLLNGETLHTKIQQGNVVGRMLTDGRTPEQIITDLYVRCLTRKPTQDEMAKLTVIVNAEADKKVALEDVFWALLNSREFVFNN